MPELPEVEGARRLTERAAVGKRVLEAIVADDTSECGWGRSAHGVGGEPRREGPGVFVLLGPCQDSPLRADCQIL